MVKQRQVRPRSLEPDTPTPGDTPSLGERIWENVGKIGKDLPEGMEAKGGGWYGSPDVIDPRDCDNFPNSVWCGGNPLSDPRKGVGLNLDWGVNECGAWASAEGTVAGVSLGNHTRAWVKEECRQDYEREERDRKHPPIEPPPDWQSGNWKPEPQYRPSGFRLDDRVCVIVCDTLFSEVQEYHGDAFGWAVATYFARGSASECNYPTSDLTPRYYPPHSLVTATCSTKGTITIVTTANPAWVWAYQTNPEVKPYTPYPPPFASSTTTFERLEAIPFDLPSGNQFTDDVDYQFRGYSPVGEAGLVNLGIFYGRFGDIFPNYQISPSISLFEGQDTQGRTNERRLKIYERKIYFCVKIDGSKPSKRPHRDSPPPPKKNCCMQCCSSQSQRDPNDDLAKILKELRDIKKVLGFSKYPNSVPKNFNRELNDNGGHTDPPMIQVADITEMLEWQAKTVDAIMGPWEVGFEFKDIDPNKEGNQPGRIVTPNVSALLTEMFSLVFDMWMMQYQQTHMHQRSATEIMLAKKVAVQNNFLLDAIADFLGFERVERKQKIEMLFNLSAEKLEDFIKNGEKEILVQEYEPHKQKNPSFRDEMLILRMMASIIQAVHTRKFDINGDMKSQLLSHLMKLNENTDKVNKNEYRTSESDFEQWLREAENAFVNRDPAPNDPTKPYGVPLEQRPRLKKITDDTPNDPNVS